MLIPSFAELPAADMSSLSRRVNANSQHVGGLVRLTVKLIKKGEC